MRYVAIVAISIALTLYLVPTSKAPPVAGRLFTSTVLVTCPSGSEGSGVIYQNGPHTFVWTAAHVVQGAQSVYQIIDANTNEASYQVLYQNVLVSQPLLSQGLKVGDVRILAKVVRFSRAHDLALLEVLHPIGHTARFAEFESAVGDSLHHVGCMHGKTGTHSYSKGVLSFRGRLRQAGRPNETEGFLYDQAAIQAYPGSSGGGLWNDRGECVGLVTEYLAKGTHGVFCFAPVRRMREFAAEYSCEWALAHVPVPRNMRVITCDKIYLEE